jgi:hypothetical protein
MVVDVVGHRDKCGETPFPASNRSLICDFVCVSFQGSAQGSDRVARSAICQGLLDVSCMMRAGSPNCSFANSEPLKVFRGRYSMMKMGGHEN